MTEPATTYDFLQPPTQPGDLGTLGNYRVLGELGKGGMGYVFRAEDTVLERPVALKVMNKKIASTPNSRDRFLQEARAMAAVHHDNVVVIFEVGTNDGTPFMAMEMLRGETLEAVNTRGTSRDYETIIRYASQIARGLAAAHAKGIVHRDIKPANIWIEEDSERIKILDFGLALAQSPLDELAGPGSVCGTPGYLTPEQARSDPLDDRSDLYSLGVVLYEMATGRIPIQRPAIAEQLVALLTHAPKPIRELNPDIPQPLADLIHALLAKEPSDRPASAAVLEKQLKQVAIECDAKSETALSLNKLQESLKEVVSKQSTDPAPAASPPKPLPMPSFDALALPPIQSLQKSATSSSASSLSGANRIGTPTRPQSKPATAPPSTVSPVVWLAAGVGITLAIVAVAVWMILPSPRDSVVVLPPQPPAPDTPANQPDPPAPKPAPEPTPDPDPTANKPKPTQPKPTPVQPQQSDTTDADPPTSPDPIAADATDPTQNNPPMTVIVEPLTEDPQIEPPDTATEPDATLAMNNNADASDPVTEPEHDAGPSQTISIPATRGLGADATVREKSANMSLGMKTNLAVQQDGSEELQHIYLRFDLQSLPVDRNQIQKAALILQLINTAGIGKLQLRVHGSDAPAAEKWAEDGPMAIKWSNSYSLAGLDVLPKLAEANGDPSPDGSVTFVSEELAEFLKTSKGNTVTLIIAGGQDDSRAVLFSSREKSEEAAPTLYLSVPE